MSPTEMSPGEQHNGRPSTDELQSEIEQTRQDLGATVDALSEKLDVKTRASERAAAVRREHGTELLAVAGGLTLVMVILVVRRRRR